MLNRLLLLLQFNRILKTDDTKMWRLIVNVKIKQTHNMFIRKPQYKLKAILLEKNAQYLQQQQKQISERMIIKSKSLLI